MKRITFILGLLLAARGVIHAQAALAPFPGNAFVNSQGQPLVGAYLCSFASGTSTPSATYTDASGTTQNANPFIVPSNGIVNVWVKSTALKFVLYVGGNGACPGTGAVQWSEDGVQVIVSDVSSLNGMTGAVTIQGTANQVLMVSGYGLITLSLPQSINVAATPTFFGMNVGAVNLGTIVQNPGAHTLLDSSGNLTPQGAITAGTTIGNANGVLIDANSNLSVHNISFSGTCSLCGSVTTQASVTGSRTQGVVYQNTGTRPMFVAVYMLVTNGGTGWAESDANANPSTIVGGTQCEVQPTAGSVCGSTLTFIVLPGSYYKIVQGSPTIAIQNWTEWQ
jgi:hypothetical protein